MARSNNDKEYTHSDDFEVDIFRVMVAPRIDTDDTELLYKKLRDAPLASLMPLRDFDLTAAPGVSDTVTALRDLVSKLSDADRKAYMKNFGIKSRDMTKNDVQHFKKELLDVNCCVVDDAVIILVPVQYESSIVFLLKHFAKDETLIFSVFEYEQETVSVQTQ